MSRTRTVLFLLGTMAAAIAAEKPAPLPEKSSPAPASEDAIAAAKRDFDAVKAARGLPAGAGGELPSFALPDFSASAAAPQSPAARVDAALAAKKKSANWLVDAMSDKTGKGKRPANPADRNAARDRLDTTDDPQADEPVEKQRFETSKTREQLANPLDRYMAAWMTPQDLALLKSSMRNGVGRGSDERDETPLPSFGGGVADAALGDQPGSILAGAGAAKPLAPRENPFLQSLGAPGGAPTASVPPSPVTPVATSPPTPVVTPPPPAPPPQKSVLPSFVKPRDEEKYYKQMKRF